MSSDIIEDEYWYKITQDSPFSPKIIKTKGTGRVLAYLLRNPGELVSLEQIAKLSGWQYPEKQIRERVQISINAWSRFHEIERVESNGKVYYRIVERIRTPNN